MANVVQTGSSYLITNSYDADAYDISVPSDANIVVVVASFWLDNLNFVPDDVFKLGGNVLTVVQKTDDQSSNGQTIIAYLASPPKGTRRFRWNWGYNLTEGASIKIIFYKNVNEADPIVSSAKTLVSDTDVTGLTAGTGDMMVGVAYGYSTTFTSLNDNGQTVLENSVYNSAAIGAAEKLGGTSFQYTGGSYQTACAIVLREDQLGYSKTSEINAGSAESVSENPWDDTTWNNPGYALTDNEDFAITASGFANNNKSYVLKAYNFDLSSIPSGAEIKGVVVRIESFAWNSAAQIGLVQLLDTSRSKTGTNKASTPVSFIGQYDFNESYTFGGETDLWGNALTESWVKNSNFGVAIGVISNQTDAEAYIDRVAIEVYYTESIPAVTAEPDSMSFGTTFDNVSVTVRKQAVPNNLEFATQNDSPAISRHRTTDIQGMAFALSYASPVVTRARLAVVSDADFAFSFENAVTSLLKTTLPDDIAHQLSFENATVTVQKTLNPNEVQISVSFDQVTVALTKTIVPDDTDFAVLLDSVVATIRKQISVENQALDLTFDSPAITRTRPASPSSSDISVSFDNVEVTVTGSILTEPNDIIFASTFDNVSISLTKTAAPGAENFAVSFEEVIITIHKTMAVNSSSMAVAFDNVIVTIRKQVSPTDLVSQSALDQVTSVVTRTATPDDMLLASLFENTQVSGALTADPANGLIGIIFDQPGVTRRVQVVSDSLLTSLGFDNVEATLKILSNPDSVDFQSTFDNVVATLTKTVIPDSMHFETTFRMFVALPELYTTLKEVKLYSVLGDKTTSFSSIAQQGRSYSRIRKAQAS